MSGSMCAIHFGLTRSASARSCQTVVVSMSSNSQNKREVPRRHAESKPHPFERHQAQDHCQPITNATGLPAHRSFTDAILDWWDTRADHIFSERERKTD